MGSASRPREDMADAWRRARGDALSVAGQAAALSLVVTALATLVALWGTFDHRLPKGILGPLLLGHATTVGASTVAVIALAAAAFCRTLQSGLNADGRWLSAGVCLAAAFAALWVGVGAHHHHTSPQLLAPGQWYLVGVLLLLLSLLAPAPGVGHGVREAALGAGIAVALAAAIPEATMLRALVLLVAALALMGAVGFVAHRLGGSAERASDEAGRVLG